MPSAPRAEREFRAAWVATVGNIDWPSKPGLPSGVQQSEALAILDTAAALGLNAVILQVRPQCDALYESSLEPWSYFLSGTEGSPPSPAYDPLSFWIAQAHDRGIELHAWFNPYRARAQRAGEITPQSIIRTRPGLARQIPNGMWWLDPGLKEVQDHSFAVVMDVLRRYDVDGIHFDDYFYPYGDGSFPDSVSFAAYRASGGALQRDDWRRENVNTFIRRVYEGIRRVKPEVKFGLSPFGIWRPGHPPSIEGFDQYAGLFADARLWLNEGWVDYWTPQLYWPVNRVPQSFPVLLGWWSGENTHARHLWPGMFTSRMTDDKGVDETINQIMIVRGFLPGAPGHVHFSMKALMSDSSRLRAELRAGPYGRQALVPPSRWLDGSPPSPPRVTVAPSSDSVTVSWEPENASDTFRWVLYRRYTGRWEYSILNRAERSYALPASRPGGRPSGTADSTAPPPADRLAEVAVSAVDRLGNESIVTVRSVDPPPR